MIFFNEIKERASTGAVGWYCLACRREGWLEASDPRAQAQREKLRLPAPAIVGLNLDACEWCAK